jgi:hypothetical protein
MTQFRNISIRVRLKITQETGRNMQRYHQQLKTNDTVVSILSFSETTIV